MKRILLLFALIIAVIIIWYGESRKFFCVDEGCITVWKTYDNVCYIIPGKYYGILKPSEKHLESSNTNLITIFISKDLPNALVFQSSEEVTVFKGVKNEFMFYDYTKDTGRFLKILYLPNAVTRVDLKAGVGLMDIDIKENIAKDKFNKRL